MKLALIITLAAGLLTATAHCAQMPDSLLNIIDRALTVHDYSTVLEYVDSRGIDYFQRKNSSRAYIKQDIINDSRTYARCKTTVYPATFITTSEGDITTESVEEDTEEWENTGKHHHAYCLFSITYSNTRPIRLISMNLKVMKSPKVGTGSGDFQVAAEPTPETVIAEASPTRTRHLDAQRDDNGFWNGPDSQSTSERTPEATVAATPEPARLQTPEVTPTPPIGIGQTFEFDGIEFTITKYKALKTYSDLRVTPDEGAVFVWITFSARNVSSETKDVDFDSLISLVGKHLLFKYSNKGPIFNFERIQPTLAKKGEILFEVAEQVIGEPMSLYLDNQSCPNSLHEAVWLPALTIVEDN